MRGEYVARPYRILDSRTGKDLRWRCYRYLHHALEGADRAALWTGIGRTLEVYDARSERAYASFTVRVPRDGERRHIDVWIAPEARKYYRPVRKAA